MHRSYYYLTALYGLHIIFNVHYFENTETRKQLEVKNSTADFETN